MTRTLNSNLTIQDDWSDVTERGLGVLHDLGTVRHKLTLGHGEGDNQHNEAFPARRTLSPASSVDDLDLSAGLVNSDGEPIRFATIKSITIINQGVPNGDGTFTPTDGEDLIIGGAGSGADGWSALFNGNPDSELVVRSGGMIVVGAPLTGYSVAPSSGDILRITLDGSGSNDVTYDIVIKGVKEA